MKRQAKIPDAIYSTNREFHVHFSVALLPPVVQVVNVNVTFSVSRWVRLSLVATIYRRELKYEEDRV